VHYFPNGHASFAKERIDVFAGGRILQLDNFRTLRGYGWSGLRQARRWRQDKGQTACVTAFIAAIRAGSSAPIPLEEILEVSRVTVAVGAAARRSSSSGCSFIVRQGIGRGCRVFRLLMSADCCGAWDRGGRGVGLGFVRGGGKGRYVQEAGDGKDRSDQSFPSGTVRHRLWLRGGSALERLTFGRG